MNDLEAVKTQLTLDGWAVVRLENKNPVFEVRERLIKLYDLDKPVHVQYAKWVSRIARLDFGNSLKDNQPVMKKIWYLPGANWPLLASARTLEPSPAWPL